MRPGFEGVVAQHPPSGLRHRWPGPDTGEGAHLDPLGMEGPGVGTELGQHFDETGSSSI